MGERDKVRKVGGKERCQVKSERCYLSTAEMERVRLEEQRRQEEENAMLQEMDEDERKSYLCRKEQEKEENRKREEEQKRREKEAALRAAEEAKMEAGRLLRYTVKIYTVYCIGVPLDTSIIRSTTALHLFQPIRNILLMNKIKMYPYLNTKNTDIN